MPQPPGHRVDPSMTPRLSSLAVLSWASSFQLSNLSSGKTGRGGCKVGKQWGAGQCLTPEEGQEGGGAITAGTHLRRLRLENYGDPKSTLSCTVRPYLIGFQEGMLEGRRLWLETVTAIPGVGRRQLSHAGSAVTPSTSGYPGLPNHVEFWGRCAGDSWRPFHKHAVL